MWGRLSFLALVVALSLAPTAQPAPAPSATKAQAITVVKRIVRRNADECKLAMTRVVARRLPIGWRVTVHFKIRGGRGYAAWHVKGKKAVPADPAAKLIGKGCP